MKRCALTLALRLAEAFAWRVALKGRKVVLCLDEAEKMLCKKGLTVEFRGELAA